MNNRKIRVAITHGDINGISYEVILKALEDNRLLELCTPVVYGSAKIAAFYRKNLDLQQISFNQCATAADIRDGVYNIINVISEDTRIEPGTSSEIAGQAAFTALERAVTDLRNSDVDVLVTAPINKKNIQSETFHFPGHTEYLEASLGEEGDKAMMILCNDNMRVALASTHVPLSKVAETLSRELIFERIRTFDASLRRDFSIPSPRIAVLSLNPHAGEDGLLGNEERDIIAPAIQDAKDKHILAFGPYASDGFFGAGRFVKFDGILAMYHDQGLAPFKALAMDNGINFTAGLPYVRTSPDHGTGYDIAGRGEASPESMRQAIYSAIDIFRNREREDEATRHPLRRQYYDKGSDNVKLDLTGE